MSAVEEEAEALPEHKDVFAALLGVQAEAPTLQKDSINPHFKNKYVSLDKLMGEVMPVLNKHGLIWVTKPEREEDGKPFLKYGLIHSASGTKVEGDMPLMLVKQDPQGQGSAITYARRYSLMAVIGLVANEDDDAKAASKETRKKQDSGPRLLNAAERAKVLKAITEAGHDEDGLLALLGAVGAESLDEVTTAQAFEIRKLLDGKS